MPNLAHGAGKGEAQQGDEYLSNFSGVCQIQHAVQKMANPRKGMSIY